MENWYLKGAGKMPEPLHIKLLELAQLKENWDGYDADPISSVALDMANVFFTLQPEYSPTADGGIDLEWEFGDYYMLLAISGKGEAQVLLRSKATPEEVKQMVMDGLSPIEKFKLKNSLEARDLLRKFIGDIRAFRMTVQDAIDRLKRHKDVRIK